MTKTEKKEYIPPEVRKVRLIQEEALLANCKTSSGTNNRAGRCRSVAACSNNVVGS